MTSLDKEALLVSQRGEEVGPLSLAEVAWLNQRGYLHDNDQVRRREDGAPLGDVYQVVNLGLKAGIPLPMNPFAVTCMVCGTPFTAQEVDTPVWCPDCGEELSPGELRRQAQGRPRRNFVLGGRRLTAMRGHEWACLLGEQPHFSRLAKWERLRGEDWTRLLRLQPALASHCRWWTLSPEQWALLVREGVVPAAWAEFAALPPGEQIALLPGQPDKEPFASYDKFTWEQWKEVLWKCPGLVGRHGEWRRFCTPRVCRQLFQDPQVPREWKALLPAEELSGQEWLALMEQDFSLAEFCPWQSVVRAIRRPASAAPAPWGGRGLPQPPRDCRAEYPRLWEGRQELWKAWGGKAMAALSRQDLWGLGDFLGWEAWIPLDGCPRQELLELLARHPDYGDLQGLWRTLTPQESLALLEKAPELWGRLSVNPREIPRPLWEPLFQAARGKEAAEAELAALYPLTWEEAFNLDDRGIPRLRRRILGRLGMAMAIGVGALLLLLSSC